MACMAGLFVAQSFAQPRDLFAEFEAEAEAARSSEAVATASSSSSVTLATPASSAAVSSSSVKQSSSSAASSSSEATSSSSVVVSSSSVAPVSSSMVASSSSVEVSSSGVADSAVVAPVADSLATAAAADSLAADSVAVDSVAASDSAAMDYAAQKQAAINASIEEARKRDSLAALSSSSSVVGAPSSSSMSRRELLGPVKVSKVNGIDEMKGRYKSPRKAMFMSLVVPGAGQMYVGGSTFTYVRGGVYLALEAALWGGWYYYSIYKYDKQVGHYKKFAKTHYSIGRYERGMRDLYNADAVNYESEFRRRYLGSRESFCEAIFGNATMHGCYDKSNVYHNDVEYMNDFVNKPKTLRGEMHKISFESPADVYQMIAEDEYVLGWDDVQDVAIATSLGLEDPNSETMDLGSSDNLSEYRSMRSKANDYADMQAWFFGGLILNHIVSAVDALFTANAHNKALYAEDLSWYDHLHFDSGVSFIDGFGVNVQASWGF